MKLWMKSIREINEMNGWRDELFTFMDYNEVIVKVALIITECAEAIESVREDNYDNFKEELADIIIRTLDLCDILTIDIDSELNKKLLKLERRGIKHGGKRV